MSSPVEQLSLIDEIDRRQNEVLDQLDQLNDRVEALLKRAAPAPEEQASSD